MAQSSTALPLRKKRGPAAPGDPHPVQAGKTPNAPLPIWGGVECTYNRVHDTYFDQTEFSGHAERLSDFQMIAALGIQTLRFGLLWDRHVRTGSWDWTDRCIHSMQASGIRPIAGLLHHGSGPPHTDLLAADFPEQLAEFAGAAAQRYPEIDAYTPVNEPNTTARFSGQYGLWYPHGRSPHQFLRALLNQVKGTVLSMRAIRRERPNAQLIQTDDAGSVTSTPELRSTADLLQARQWLTFDLLCGTVDRAHPMFAYLSERGIPEHDIFWFRDNPCPPDVVGLNYYVTSDRFLDHRAHQYPIGLGSSEGPFIDVEAVRVDGLPEPDFGKPIREAWQRYGRPVALTEVHLGGQPAEQVRWLAAAYRVMQQAQQDGVHCASLTVWALLGSYFWNEMVTRENGHYEAGVFDVSSGQPLPTPLTEIVRQIAQGQAPHHPLLAEPGWWQRTERTCYPWLGAEAVERAA